VLLLCCGRPRIACLILSDAVGASNEPPDDDELDALFDRFLLRRWVRPVSREGRPALLSLKQTTATVDTNEGGSSSPSIALFTESDVKELKKTAVTTVTIPDDVKQLIEDLLLFLDESGVYVSDRRLVKAAAMLRVAALTSGRTAVSKFDCLLLQHVFWKNPEEAERIQEWFVDYLREPGAEVDQVQFLLGGFCKRMWRTAAENDFSTTDDPSVADQRQATIEKWQLGDLLPLKRILVGKLLDWEKEVVDDEAILSAHIWQTSEDMTRLTQRLRPNLESRRAQVRTVLQEVRCTARPTCLLPCLQAVAEQHQHSSVHSVPKL
jgi:MoxR-like ATPase